MGRHITKVPSLPSIFVMEIYDLITVRKILWVTSQQCISSFGCPLFKKKEEASVNKSYIHYQIVLVKKLKELPNYLKALPYFVEHLGIMDFENEALKLEAKQWSRIRRSKYRLLVQLLLTRTLVLLLSAFLFSNLVSLFTELPFLYSYTYSFSTFLLPLFTQILDRKCMFLLCNAIMAFLGVKSRLYSASSFEKEAEADDMPPYIMNAEHDMLLQPLTFAEPVSEVESGAAASVSYKQNKLLKDDEIVLASRYEVGVEESCEQEEDQACADVDIKDDEYGSTESPTNSEELNNRIEEFIRKMKEDIRLEAQQPPPIAV